MKLKYKEPKPSRQDLFGYSASEFKTFLKRKGFEVPRDFYKRGSIAKRDNRLYRFRWWSHTYKNGNYSFPTSFKVDISEPVQNFDRWANSTEKTITFEEFLNA